MRNIFTIFQREFATYFNSPIGYIYIIVFVLINAILFVPTFWIEPTTDMRSMFDRMPLLLCILLPLVSMRLWAEDRKENTIEMLLTFPMPSYQLVLGKYLASLAFFIMVLLGTLTIPCCIAWLGEIDSLVIVSSYLGLLVLGSCFLALGVFISALARDQIVAAILTMASCFTLFLLGTNYIAPILDDCISGLGTLLRNIISVTPHYDSFGRGIISITDIVFFLVWTSIFLFLNGLYLEGRSRSKATMFFILYTVACFVIGMMFNYLVYDIPMGRLDCTKNQIYSVSSASQNIFEQLETKAIITLYISPQDQMPTNCKNLERDISDFLKEIVLASNKKVTYTIEYLEVKNFVKDEEEQPTLKNKNDKKRQQSKEELLASKKIVPYAMPTLKESQYTNTLIYASIGIKYGAKPEKIIERVMPQELFKLEYQITRALYFLSLKKSPRVVLVAPPPDNPMRGQITPYDIFAHFLSQEGYDTQTIDLTKENPLPDFDKYDLVLVFAPQNFNARQRWELARVLHAGKPMLIAAQDRMIEYRPPHKMNPSFADIYERNETNPQISDWLEKYGVKLNSNILLDVVRYNQSGSIIDFTNIIVTGNNISREFSMTNCLQEVLYLSGSAIQLDQDKLTQNQLSSTVLMKTSSEAWLVSDSKPLEARDFRPDNKNFQQYPLMVLIQGQFPDVYAGQPRPIWMRMNRQGQPMPVLDEKNPEPEPKPVTPQPSTLLFIGNSQLYYRAVLLGRQIMTSIPAPDNHELMMKSVDFLASQQKLGTIPSRMVEAGRIERPKNVATYNFLFYLLVPLLSIIIGTSRSLWRKMNREKYLQSLSNL